MGRPIKLLLTRPPRSTAWPPMALPMVRVLYLNLPTHTHCPTNRRQPWSLYIFFPLVTLIDIRPNHALQHSTRVCVKILPLYVVLFRRRLQTCAYDSSNYLVACEFCAVCWHFLVFIFMLGVSPLITVLCSFLQHIFFFIWCKFQSDTWMEIIVTFVCSINSMQCSHIEQFYRWTSGSFLS